MMSFLTREAGTVQVGGLGAYAIGILAGTVVQFLLPLPWLRGRGGSLSFRIDWRDERVRRVRQWCNVQLA